MAMPLDVAFVEISRQHYRNSSAQTPGDFVFPNSVFNQVLESMLAARKASGKAARSLRSYNCVRPVPKPGLTLMSSVDNWTVGYCTPPVTHGSALKNAQFVSEGNLGLNAMLGVLAALRSTVDSLAER
uniref:Uncharacterized protein n=1 Tax=Coccidioides posadasii RMSCC 3488 TaxID=454284 RepID=A0A0J6FV13_COCPO|nr:hypothetical protein CPAG_09288 [Coccidioides posadasii RMSCC 3488]